MFSMIVILPLLLSLVGVHWLGYKAVKYSKNLTQVEYTQHLQIKAMCVVYN